MRETPAEFALRTGREYTPPAWMFETTRPLGPHDSLPTLFRFPGVSGLSELLCEGTLPFCGPPHLKVFLSAEFRQHADARGAREFGTLALLQPLRYLPARKERPGVHLCVNLPLDAAHVAWVPPSAFGANLPWDRIATSDELRDCLGDTAHEQEIVRERLRACLAEIRALNAAGAPWPGRPWCELPADQRHAILERHGVEPTWTKATEPARSQRADRYNETERLA